MATITFQGKIRTFVGRAKSAVDKRTRRAAPLLPQNLAGPIQIVLTNPGTGTYEVGFLPGGFCIERVRVITAAGAGTFAITTLLYGSQAALPIVAAGASATSKAADLTLLAPALMAPLANDAPLSIATVGVTGTLRFGIFGFPLDNARTALG